MSDIIQLPKLSATILGSSYPILDASIDVAINSLLTFSVTITTSDAKDGGILTVNMIRKLAAKAQDAIYKTPKESNATLTISGYGGATLNVEGIINQVNCYANTSGGLSCTISAIGNDSLLSCVGYDVYLSYANSQKVSEKVYSINKDAKNGCTYVTLLSPSQRESTGDSIAKRMWNLINCAQGKWKELAQLEDQPNAVKQAIQNIAKINESATAHVRKFLGRSDKTSKLLNGKVKINEATSNQVMNGLHNLLFAKGNNFLEAVFAACGEYELWYLPKLKEKGKGYLENSKFGDEESGSTASVYCTNFSYQGGNRWWGRPPCIGTIMQAQSYINAAANTLSVKKSPASRMLTGSYPTKPSKQWGAVYIYNAPGWVALPLISTEESQTVTKGVAEQFKSGTLQKKERNKNLPKINYNTTIQKQKPNVESLCSILDYLAKKEYYRVLLTPSTAEVTGAYSGAPNAEVGDMIDVQANPGGKIVSGILHSMAIRVAADGASTITYRLCGASISGSKID